MVTPYLLSSGGELKLSGSSTSKPSKKPQPDAEVDSVLLGGLLESPLLPAAGFPPLLSSLGMFGGWLVWLPDMSTL